MQRSAVMTSRGGQALQAHRAVRGSPVARRGASLRLASKRSRSQVIVEARKVALLGAGGGIGQPLALLLKMSKYLSELALYDIANVVGVAADLSHCNTPVKVYGYTGEAQLESALKGAELVIIPAGIPRKPGMTRDDLFNINAGIVRNLIEGVARYCPKAVVHIISNPVNSTVPIASEVLKANGVFDPTKLIGVTTLDIVRANTFVADSKGIDLNVVDVPVIGGHAGITILPLLSQVTPALSFTDEERKYLTERIQNAGTEVVEAKNGAGSATLSMAYAACRMAEATLLGLQGEPNIFEYAYVSSSVQPDLPFFSSKIQLGPEGVAKVFPVGPMNEFETEIFNRMLPELKGSIAKGLEFAKNPPAAKKPDAVKA